MEAQDIKNTHFLPSIESMSKAKSFLLITSTILYIDCVLAIAFRKNIKTFSWNSFSVSENIFYLTVTIFIYCALLAFLLPTLNHVTVIIINSFKYKFGKYKESAVRYNCQSDVSLLAAKHYAEAKNNYVLYKKCEEIETTNNHSAELSKFAFCVIILAGFNWLALGDGTSKTITQSLWG